MSGSGLRPTTGARFVLERAAETANDEVWYRGFAHLPDADVALSVRVTLPSGATEGIALQGDEGSAGEGSDEGSDEGSEEGSNTRERGRELAKTAAALVRAATKAAASTGGPFPRKIMRWR